MSLILPCSCHPRYITRVDGPPRCSSCGCSPVESRPARKSASVDYNYECPVTGIPIQSKAAHLENLKRHGCHVLEPGELAHADHVREANQKRLDAQLDASIDATVDNLVQSMPTDAQERLASEILSTCPDN